MLTIIPPDDGEQTSIAVTTDANLATGDVEIVFIKRHHRVEIDMDKLTWGDVLKLRTHRDAASSGEMTEDQAQVLLSALVTKVTGQEAEMLPASVVNRVIEAMFGQVNQNGSGPNSNGG